MTTMTTTTESDLALPPGADTADAWEGDHRYAYREVGVLQLSADPLRNPVVAAMCEQRRDGRIGAVEIAFDDTSMAPDQARELAGLLHAAADQADQWAGLRPSAADRLTALRAALHAAYMAVRLEPGNAGDYLGGRARQPQRRDRSAAMRDAAKTLRREVIAAHTDALLSELAGQVEDHPPSTWSARLLQIVTGAIDLEFGGEDRGGPGPRLTIVEHG